MASAIKIIYLLETIKILYKMSFHSLSVSTVLYITQENVFSKPKHQHFDRTLKEKLQILNKLECGMKAIDVCKEFNLSQSTLSTWKKQSKKLKDMVDAGKVLDTKRNRESFLPNFKRALHIWFGEMRSKPHNPPLSKQVLVEKAT